MDGLEFLQKGGPVMYLLLICSLSVAVIAAHRWLYYRRMSAGAEELFGSVAKLAGTSDNKEIGRIAEDKDNVVAFIVKAAYKAAQAGENIAVALDIAYGEAAFGLRRYLNYLSMIVTLAPLLGLLGTIFGMIRSFSVFNMEAGTPLAITGGIGEALIATATGLCVAIFALVVHTYFAQRLDALLTLTEKTEAVISAALANDKKTAGGTHDAA